MKKRIFTNFFLSDYPLLAAILLDIQQNMATIYFYKTIYGNLQEIIHIYSSSGYRTEGLAAGRLVKEKMFTVSILGRLINPKGIKCYRVA